MQALNSQFPESCPAGNIVNIQEPPVFQVVRPVTLSKTSFSCSSVLYQIQMDSKRALIVFKGYLHELKYANTSASLAFPALIVDSNGALQPTTTLLYFVLLQTK